MHINSAPAAGPMWPDLTVAVQDTSTLAQVLGGYHRRQLRVALTLPSSATSARIRPLLVALQRHLRQLAKGDLAAALSWLQWPTHNVLLACIQQALEPGGPRDRLDEWVEEWAVLTWLELARTGHGPVPFTWRLSPSGPTLRSIVGNFAIAPRSQTVVLKVGRAQASLDGIVLPRTAEEALPKLPSNLAISRPYFRIVDGVWLAIDDNNPLSDFEAHPDKTGNTLDLGGRTPQQWCDVLRRCFELVDRYLPLLGEELRLVARQVIPVGFDEEKHLSASYKESIGTAYMSVPPNVMTMAEALIHEFQHNKLNAAAYLDPMLHNAFAPLYASPVRPDPRPLWGVLLAVHAFLPVAQLYRQMTDAGHEKTADPSFQRRFSQIAAKNHDGTNTITAHAKTTPIGAGLVAELKSLDGGFSDRWPAEQT